MAPTAKKNKKGPITKCPRCPDDATSGVHRHYREPNGGLKRCLQDVTADKMIWPKYISKEQIEDADSLDAHNNLFQQAVQDKNQEIMKDLLTAAFLEQPQWTGVTISKQLLEACATNFDFSDDFLDHLKQAALEEKERTKNPAQQPGPSIAGESLTIRTKDNDNSAFDAAPQRKESSQVASNSKSEYEIHALRPGYVATNASVTTNHFTITLASTKVLHEYAVNGLQSCSTTLTAQKKMILLDRMIDECGVLRNHRDDFARDNERKIISVVPLHDDGVLPGTVIATQRVNNYKFGSNSEPPEPLELQLEYMREIKFSGLKDFVEGKNQQYQEEGAAEALNILLARSIRDGTNSTFQVEGNKFFTPHATLDLHNYGLMAMRGFYSGVKPGDGNVLLNVNTAASAFYKSMLVSEYMNMFEENPKNFSKNGKGKAHLKGLRARVEYKRGKADEVSPYMDTEKGRLKTITGFSDEPADMVYFENRAGQRISVWDHFSQTYPDVAANSSKDQICVNTRTEEEPCWFLPDQLKVMENQIYPRLIEKLDSDLAGEMIKFACQLPQENCKSILDHGLKAIGLSDPASPPALLRRAGVHVATVMETIPAKEIISPKVMYKDSRDETRTKYVPDNAEKPWAWTTRDMGFLSRKARINGDIVFITPGLKHEGNEKIYLGAFSRAYHLNGIKEASVSKQIDKLDDFSIEQLHLKLSSGAYAKAGFVILVLDEQGPDQRMKHANFRVVMDQLIGKPSMTICESSMIGSVDAKKEFNVANLIPYFANNAMKMNLRLGNSNHSVEHCFDILCPKPKMPSNTLILGADIIHKKSCSAKGTPSIAAVVGNVDDSFTKFLGSVRRQNVEDEYIHESEMISMVVERLKAWREKHNNTLPARILYYRDGVGQSQYRDIRRYEVEAIRKAYKKLMGIMDKPPAITAVIVTKRHNTRFYPLDPHDKHEKTLKGNCLPGTVVDSRITSPYYFDFYLQSHCPLQGSAKPTYYFVVENGMNFTADQLQDLTNALCYTFQHSTNAVSYVPPAYYADKLCERAALYLKPFFDGDRQFKEMAESEIAKKIDLAWARGKQEHSPWNTWHNDKMFWM